MPVTLPPSVRQALDDPASDDLEKWFRNALDERAVTRDEYREVLSCLDVIENDLGHLQGNLDSFREDVNDRFQQVDEQFQHLNDRLDQTIRTMTRWTVGSLAFITTLITTLIAIAEFF